MSARADLERELGVPVVFHDAVDSTMDLAEADPRPAAVHVADSQRHGQGRRGRAWISPPGNLYATIAWEEGGEALPPSVLAAIQVEWAARIASAGGPLVQCKWPNDGLVGGGKWAGLLARRRPSPHGTRLLVGLGANLESLPESPPPGGLPAARLVDHWRPWPGRARVTEELLRGAIEVLREESAGIRRRLERWGLHDAWAPGEEIVVRRAGEALRGRYDGVDAEGHLRWIRSGRAELLTTDEVELVRPGGAPSS